MDKIPYIGCINLLSRDDRYNESINEFNKIGILNKVNFLRVEKHQISGRIGCWESHRKIWIDALNKGCEYCMVFEDDFIFLDEWKQSIEYAIDFIENNKDWHLINLSNRLLVKYYNSNYKNQVFNSSFTGFSTYIASKSFMEKAIKFDPNDTIYGVDAYFSNITRKTYHVFPSVSSIRQFTTSDNENWAKCFDKKDTLKNKLLYFLIDIFFKLNRFVPPKIYTYVSLILLYIQKIMPLYFYHMWYCKEQQL